MDDIDDGQCIKKYIGYQLRNEFNIKLYAYTEGGTK